MAPEMPREQEQSIKARKKELFDAESDSKSGPSRRFSEYIRDTPPAPLAKQTRLGLWLLGGFVVLLFLAALMTSPGQRRKSPPGPKPYVRQEAAK